MGSGHLSRMLSLLWRLNCREGITATIQGEGIAGNVPEELKKHVTGNIDPGTDLIIRDMRDSTAEDIRKLRMIAPVLVLDDLGEGRHSADFRMSLLPNLEDTTDEKFIRDFFLYGYRFIRSLGEIGGPAMERDIDVLIYPGFTGDGTGENMMISLVPPDASYSLLRHKVPYTIVDSRGARKTSRSYPGMLLTARVFISHFGIGLFEASLAGCRLIALNPTRYHADLCNGAAGILPMINLGTRENLDMEQAAAAVDRALHGAGGPAAVPEEIYSRVLGNIENFISHILSQCR